jgi:hypothetical protein
MTEEDANTMEDDVDDETSEPSLARMLKQSTSFISNRIVGKKQEVEGRAHETGSSTGESNERRDVNSIHNNVKHDTGSIPGAPKSTYI